MDDDTSFVFEKVIAAPADLIFRAFTSSRGFRDWLCDRSATNPIEGGFLSLAWNHGYYASGHFTHLEPNMAVSFTWIGRGEPDWTHVDVTITPTLGEGRYKVKLHHRGIGKSPEWEDAQAEITKGWHLGFENLKSVLEDGRDLRMMNRPLIGIFPFDFSLYKDTARESMGVPVDYGVLVLNVVPGFGADKAGIRSDDVIVSIGGKKVENISSMFAIVPRYEPGDRIIMTVYRGSEQLVFEVDTTPQIFEALPSSTEDLAKEIESNSTMLLEKLNKVLAGVSEAEAAFSPGPEQWSAKEIIVECILHERDLQSWINNLVTDQECFCEDMPMHGLFQIRATLTTYPTLNDLMAELRRSFKETVACVAFLDQKVTRKKASYWRVAYELMEKVLGYEEFIRHIENSIQMARNNLPDQV
jgi:uncharacterized protein YndB with AHSA1/START domain